MSRLATWKKVAVFGALGAVGCLAGWLVGELYLRFTSPTSGAEGAGRGPSLISKPVSPSSEAPPLPSDFRERLERAGGKSGDVQLSLVWNNVNDLDLHCKDPNGDIIFYKFPRARSGGELDVDANADSPRNGRAAALTNEPVENIYWPKDGAPPGKYQVFINHFAHRPEAGAQNRTRYKVNVLHDGQRHEFEGEIENNGTPHNERVVYEFELKPRLALSAPGEAELRTATAVKVPIAVRRSYFKGPVEVRAEGLPEGVTADKITLPAGTTEGEIELKATDGAKQVKTPIKLVATGGGLESSAEVQFAVPKSATELSLVAIVSIGVWTALLAIGLCLALVVGQNKYLGKKPFASGRTPLAQVLLGAATSGFVSGSVGQVLYVLLLSAGVAKIGFIIGWMLLGGLLGWGVSFFIPNLDATKAALAGLSGGLLGAVAFLIAAGAGDWIGRFSGAALLGFCIGLMVAVVEAAFRRAWLEVRFGEREVITVNLGAEPVKVGGDARASTVWARGAADVALRYWIRDGEVFCEDVPARREAPVADGDTRTAGGVTVVVRTSATPPPAASAPAPVAARTPVPLPLPPVPAAAVPPRPVKPTADDYDDGLPMPMPMAPTAPPRPSVASILDLDEPPAKPAPKPAAPPIPRPPVAGPKPPVPAPPHPQVPAVAKPPVPSITPKAGAPDACPTCGRKIPGTRGARYCMVCDKTF